MKIIACGPDEVIVSMKTRELERVANIKIGDYYGNGGISYTKAAGKEIDLIKFTDSLYELKQAHEIKERVKQDLELIISKIDKAYFPIADFNDYKAAVIKND